VAFVIVQQIIFTMENHAVIIQL